MRARMVYSKQEVDTNLRLIDQSTRHSQIAVARATDYPLLFYRILCRYIINWKPFPETVIAWQR